MGILGWDLCCLSEAKSTCFFADFSLDLIGLVFTALCFVFGGFIETGRLALMRNGVFSCLFRSRHSVVCWVLSDSFDVLDLTLY
jgi:hypothetical protein